MHDFDRVPLPLEDGRFDLIECQDVLEHVEMVPVLRELHRVLAPAGRLHVQTPDFTSRVAYIDPTHQRSFSVESFDYFVRGKTAFGEFYFDFQFSASERARITFHRRWHQPWNWLIEPLVNGWPWLQRYFEATGFSRLFPALNVELTLVK